MTAHPESEQDLASALQALYAEAGSPTLRSLARKISEGRGTASASPSSISDWMHAKAVPSRKMDLAALVAVLTSSTHRSLTREPARFEELRKAAILKTRSRQADAESSKRPWLGRPVESYNDPLTLEVHRPIQMDGAPSGLPRYIERAHDFQLRTALKGDGSNLLILAGGSSTGKTRAAYEAVRSMPGWLLYHPISPNKPEALLEALTSNSLNPRTIIWLNELQDYLLPDGGEQAAASLRTFLDENAGVKLVGTIWPRYWQQLTDPTGSFPQSKALLSHRAIRIDIDNRFEPTVLSKAAEGDPRLRAAINASAGRITQYIAAGPALLEFFNDCRDINPGTWAILSAAMDAYAVGRPDSLSEKFLREASPGYLSDEEWSGLTEDWFANSLTHAGTELRGAARPMLKVRQGEEGCDLRFRLADYLVQHSQAERSQLPVPASFWKVVTSHVTDYSSLAAFARAADERGMFKESAFLWSELASEGDPIAVAALLSNPSMDPAASRATADRFIDNLDLSDTMTVGWALIDFHQHPTQKDRLVQRIAKTPELLTTGPPLEMGVIYRELSMAGEAEAAHLYARSISRSIGDIEMKDFWSTASLIEDLTSSGNDDIRDFGHKIALAQFEQEDMDAEMLAAFINYIEPGSDLDERARTKLRSIAHTADITNTIRIHPFIANLFVAGESEMAHRFLRRVSESVSTLHLGSSYAPLELLSTLRLRGYEKGVAELSQRIAEEFEPGLSHSSVVALDYLRRNHCTRAFHLLSRRLAETGPILPLHGAEELLNFLATKSFPEHHSIYADRVRAFRHTEGK
ncbi:hypothetical protein ACFWUQ_23780 [Streptomyces sp. NPDC058662]|uniref:hypothetical protein n=1 Tax=Streptomyces sp. NPDC058662 TaxID=3346583 RepID=UPI00364D19C8